MPMPDQGQPAAIEQESLQYPEDHSHTSLTPDGVTVTVLAYADGSSLETIALKACTVAPILLLQKPSRTSKSKDHVNHL